MKFVKVINPEYACLRLIPISSIKNNNNQDIVSIINKLYVNMYKSIKFEDKCINLYGPSKVSFVLDMYKDQCSFYLIIPKQNLNEFQQKLTESFGKITIEEVECIPKMSNDCTKYSLDYAKDDSLSITLDKRDNDLLSANMSVMDILEDDDRVSIVYNFLPSSLQFLNSWKKYHVNKMAEYQNGVSLDKNLSTERVLKTGFKLLFDLLDILTSVVSFAFGQDDQTNNDLFKRLVPVQELTKASTKKENAEIIRTQVMLLSKSQDPKRELSNAKTLINSFKIVEKDNNFVAKRIDKPIGIKKKENKGIGIKRKSKLGIRREILNTKSEEAKEDNYDFEAYSLETDIMRMSKEEVGVNCLCLPGKKLIDEHKINSVKHTETVIPYELTGGSVRYGTNIYRGKSTVVTTSSTNEDANCMPVLIMSKMGGGKSTLFENQGVDAVRSGEGLITIDFIKNCEMSDNILRNIDRKKAIVIDFSDYMCQEAFSFNELNMIRDMNSSMSRYECAGLQNALITQFIESLGTEEFSASMGRYLDAACSAVLIHENKSIRDIVACLENYVKRAEYMKLLAEFKPTMPEEYQDLIEDDLIALEELNEYREIKVNNKKTGEQEICGTANNKISGIISRISLLKKNPSLKFMYARRPKNNINLTKLMQEGKAIFFKLPQNKFSSVTAKNVMVSYLFSKIELAGIVRAEIYKKEKLRTVNVICDEIHQSKDSFGNIDRICSELRKFRTKLILSTHGFDKIKPIQDSLIGAGASILLLRGSAAKNFEVMKYEFEQFGFTVEDLTQLSKDDEYKALCLIASQRGRFGCIVRLPDPVKNKIEMENIA